LYSWLASSQWRAGENVRAGSYALLLGALAVAAAAVILSLAVDLPAGASFVAGVLLGGVTLGSVSLRVLPLGRPVSARWRVAVGLLRWLHLPIAAALVWLLVTRWQAAGAWLAAGYTLSLIVFVVILARPRRAQVSGKPAE